MKIEAKRADAFVRAPDGAARAVLVYGPDTGLVRERARALVAGAAGEVSDPFRVAELTGGALASDPARLADEAQAISLTGGRRAVWVREATDALAGLFESFLADAPGDALVVVEGGDLSPRAKLRALFERAANAAAVPCYVDEGQALSTVIATTLRERGLAVAPDALAYLSTRLGGDRMAIRSEIEKLALYCLNETEVALDDAELCVGDSAEMTLEDLAYAAAGGEQHALARALARVAAEGTSPVTVLRAAARHFQRLHFAKAMMAGGADMGRAIGALRPKPFFKREAPFRAQLGRWPLPALADALDSLAAAEADCKTTGLPAEAICERTLVALCARAARAASGTVTGRASGGGGPAQSTVTALTRSPARSRHGPAHTRPRRCMPQKERSCPAVCLA